MMGSPVISHLWTMLVLLAVTASAQDAKSGGKCGKIKFEPCQKEVLRSNREFVARYTLESVESFSVNLFEPPILRPTRSQMKALKQQYRNMFIYPSPIERTVAPTEAPHPTESPLFGTLVDRNETCTNTTEKGEYQGWLRITEMIQCNTTDLFGGWRISTERSTRYERLPEETVVRGKRAVNRLKLCDAEYSPPESVLYSVNKVGDAFQVVQSAGAYQDQGDAECISAASKPRTVTCELELIESPRVVFRLSRKHPNIETANIKIPRCTAYMEL